MQSCKTLMDSLLWMENGYAADVVSLLLLLGVRGILWKALSLPQSCEKILAMRLGISLLSTDILFMRDIDLKK